MKMHEKGFVNFSPKVLCLILTNLFNNIILHQNDSEIALTVFLKDTTNKSVRIIENKIKLKVALYRKVIRK